MVSFLPLDAWTLSKSYSIGIDPGKQTGLAVYDRFEKRLEIVARTTFWEAIEFIAQNYPQSQVRRVVIELPKSKAVWHNKATARGAIQRTSVNVGSVIREAELLVEYFKRAGYEVITQHPKGKRTAHQVKKITGYQGRTNEHTRDAIMLCWGL